MTKVIFIYGISCSGKSTLVQCLMNSKPEGVGFLQIGKILRAHYGEASFKGQAAPENLEGIALDLLGKGVGFLNVLNHTIIVDGQPKNMKQLREIFDIATLYFWDITFYSLHTTELILQERANNISQTEGRKLANSRIRNEIQEQGAMNVELLDKDKVCFLQSNNHEGMTYNAEFILNNITKSIGE